MSKLNFRNFLPSITVDTPSTAREYAKKRLLHERPQTLFQQWKNLLADPFKGITVDGNPSASLFNLQREGAPVREASNAAIALLNVLPKNKIKKMQFPIDSKQWQNWQNTELYVEKHGLRLDEQTTSVQKFVMALIRTCLSPKGYTKSRNVMKLNAFLGELIEKQNVLNEWSYTFCLFGTPSPGTPWGWQLFGHHLCLNCFLLDGQMVLTPAFMGAEPAFGDEGKYAKITLFKDEELRGLEFMLSLDKKWRKRALIANSMVGGDLPHGRRHFADNLQLGGAYQDNRIVPFEGLKANNLGQAQQQHLLDLINEYHSLLPDKPREKKMLAIEKQLDNTHFCWIGRTDEDSPFYYRIQSPVTFIEFDHHTGVFLTNDKPAKFHIHTIVRTPNGNDYGKDLLRQHYQTSPHHKKI